RLILAHASRARGVELLRESGLLEVVLPEVISLYEDATGWPRTLAILDALKTPTFAVALGALLRELHIVDPARHLSRVVFERWRLSNEELAGVKKLLAEESIIRSASKQPWS